MSEKTTDGIEATQAEDVALETTEDEEPTLTEKLMEGFEEALERDGKQAYAHWGFGLYHSLDYEKVMAQKIEMGFKPTDALDHYNMGCVKASAGKFADAISEFNKAIGLNAELTEAHFNLALATELKGDATKARKLWQAYCDMIEDDAEQEEIKQHLAEL